MGKHKSVTIYAMADPRNNRIRYVGQTVLELPQRLKEHYKDCKNQELLDWFNELGRLGMKPKMLTLAKANFEDRYFEEKKHIRRAISNGCKLINITNNPGFWERSPKISDVRQQINALGVTTVRAKKNWAYIEVSTRDAGDYERVKHLESEYITVKLYTPLKRK